MINGLGGGASDLWGKAQKVGADVWNVAQQNFGRSVVQEALDQSRRPVITDPLKIKREEAAKLQRYADGLKGTPGHAEALERASRASQEFQAERAKNIAGKTLADYLSDASRSKWWLLNAAQAVSGLAGQKIMKSEGYGMGGALLGGAALTGLMEVATGNIDFTNLDEAGRPKGYSTLFPKEIEQVNPATGETEIYVDRTKSANPVAELAARYFLNRTGNVLPEDQFLQERPDVTPEEYARFKAAKRDRQFFGVEDLPISVSAPIGAIAGGLIDGKLTKPSLRGMVAGAVLGPIAKQIAIDVPTELGVIHGTTETPNDPIGEVEFLGYRVPLKAVVATAVGAAGLKYGGRYLKNQGAKVGQINLNLDDAVGGVKPGHRYSVDEVIAQGGGTYREPPPSSGYQNQVDNSAVQYGLDLDGTGRTPEEFVRFASGIPPEKSGALNYENFRIEQERKEIERINSVIERLYG
ncbi:hypothetical protein [Nodosilinea nodulosa]|uniref:hypothetical protein n=1 Tax=Nodosilinea nodulosa TaxID=416001 RepID=UPI0002D8C3F7|nr:hypothetical protein [Nodosilinea nodulosa]